MNKDIVRAFRYEVEVGSTDIGPDEDRLRGLVSWMTKEEAQEALKWWLQNITRRIRMFEKIDAPRIVIDETRALRNGEIAKLLRNRIGEAEV